MRGYEPHDLIGKGSITAQDIAPYIYPSDEDISRAEVRVFIFRTSFLGMPSPRPRS